MKTKITSNFISKNSYGVIFMALCLFFSIEGFSQGCATGSCGGDGYGAGVPLQAGAIKTAIQNSMTFDNDMRSALFTNQAKIYKSYAKGTPYMQEDFTTANIAPVNKVYMVRYNVHQDEMEVKQAGDEVLVMAKKKNFTVKEHSNNRTYKILEKANSDVQNDLGYYITLQTNDNLSLYRKNCKKLVTRKRNTYGSTAASHVAEFKDMRCEFYIEKGNNGVAIKLPKKKKALLALFPEKKEQIATYIKKNRIKLHKEKSVKKLIDYINTI